jgi:hypothetical protein
MIRAAIDLPEGPPVGGVDRTLTVRAAGRAIAVLLAPTVVWCDVRVYLVPILAEVMAPACCLVELCDEASDQRGGLARLADRGPELANDILALNDGEAHANVGDALGFVLATDVVEQLIAADDGFVRRVLDVDRVVGEQVREACVIPGLPGSTVALDKGDRLLALFGVSGRGYGRGLSCRVGFGVRGSARLGTWSASSVDGVRRRGAVVCAC